MTNAFLPTKSFNWVLFPLVSFNLKFGALSLCFRLNEEGEHYMLELNALPGMTATSLLPKAAKSAGLNFTNLVDTIVGIASIKR